ncbi:MAG: RidA family protein [Burkholderiaceae bacterium]
MSNAIERMQTNQRMSQCVVHGNTIYLAGQVGNPGESVADQTTQILAKIDGLLEQAGSSRQHILQAVIWLADMKDFGEMNAVWDAWVPEGHAPARACGESKLARPDFTVEITVVAAKA